MVIRYLRAKNQNKLIDVIKRAEYDVIKRKYADVSPYFVGSDREGFELAIKLSAKDYDEIEFSINDYENLIKHYIDHMNLGDLIKSVKFYVKVEHIIDWFGLPHGIDKDYILAVLDWEKNVLISVSTGGEPIQSCDDDYKKYHAEITQILSEILIKHVNPFSNLWDWYHYYKKNLPQYASRRVYVNNLFEPLIKLIENSEETPNNSLKYIPTGWEKIDRGVLIMKEELDKADTGSRHQAVGLHGRELLMTLAQIVYDEKKHKHPDGNPINSGQSVRMLEAYIRSFSGVLTDETRAFARAAVSLSNNLTHDRNAGELGSELCYIAVVSTINIIHNINKYEEI